MDTKEKPKPKKDADVKSEEVAAKKAPAGKQSPENSGITPAESSLPPSNRRGVGSGKAKHSIPQTLGADKYKETIKKADDYFKMKRYSEARDAYEEALLIRPNDAHAKSRLEQISKLSEAGSSK